MAERVWSERDLVRRANRGLAVLRHAEEVSGNVAATCRYYGISRNIFYRWKRRYTAGRLVAAGGMATVEQIRDRAAAGVDAFAVGQTAFTGAFNLLMGSLSAQLHDALAAALEET